MAQYLLRHIGITCDQQGQILEMNIFNKFYLLFKNGILNITVFTTAGPKIVISNFSLRKDIIGKCRIINGS